MAAPAPAPLADQMVQRTAAPTPEPAQLVTEQPVTEQPAMAHPTQPSPQSAAAPLRPQTHQQAAENGHYVSAAHRQAAMELARLKDEEAVFSVMITSTKLPREARWAKKQLKDVEEKLERMERIVAKFDK
jgi:hypothetical protein